MELVYYIFFIVSSYLLAKQIEHSCSILRMFFLAIYMAFFLAIRQVPGDNMQYENAYMGKLFREYEIGWAFLIEFCRNLGLSLVAYKCLAIYLIQIFSFFLSIRKEWYSYFSIFVLLYCLLGIESSSNIMRHWMSACLVLIGYRVYLQNNNYLKQIFSFSLFVIVASKFHSSAYLAFLAPFLLRFKIPSAKVQCILFVVLYFSSSLFMDIWSYASMYLNFSDFQYNFYFNEYEVKKVEMTSGLGQLYVLLETCIIAWIYSKFSEKGKDENELCMFSAYYKLYFWGMTIYFVTCSYEDMARLSLYFFIVQIIVLSNIISMGLKSEKRIRNIVICILFMRAALFIRTVLAAEIFGITPIKFLI